MRARPHVIAGGLAIGALALGGLVLILLPGAVAWATPGGPAPTHLSMSSPTTTVSGRPLAVRVALSDRAGKPVAGATIRLVTTTTFFGADRSEVLDEAVTGPDGKAELTFSPADAGSTTVSATYAGDQVHAASKASMTFRVLNAVPAYHPTPVGIQAPWARSYFILVPFLGVWITYLVVVAQIRAIRRAGAAAPSPEGESM